MLCSQGLANVEALLQMFSGFYARCMAAQQLVVIYDETLALPGLCADLRTSQILHNLEQQLPSQVPLLLLLDMTRGALQCLQWSMWCLQWSMWYLQWSMWW